MSATFATDLEKVLAMPWDEVIAWWAEAMDIDRERWAPLRQMIGG